MVRRWWGKPQLSVVVVAFNMRREIVRTLYTLGTSYQHGVKAADYEVILVDNGSTPELDCAELAQRFQGRLRTLRLPPGTVSPVEAVNAGVALARADRIAVMVDGARMLSPGMLRGMLQAFQVYPDAFVSTLGWHLGEQPQNLSMVSGYNQQVEDQLLASFDWEQDGYQLFNHACLALSCQEGWFSSIAESNCFALPKRW